MKRKTNNLQHKDRENGRKYDKEREYLLTYLLTP